MPGDAPARKCTECETPVSGKALTCSDRCRTRRSVRLRAERARGQVDRTGAEDIAQEILREEIRPVVREALTEEVLRGIEDLIGHVPDAVAAATALLQSGDEEMRYKAAALIMRHTVGHKAIVPDVNEGSNAQMTVVFGIPRPDEVPADMLPRRDPDAPALLPPPVELRECDACGADKPADDFIANSNRCDECFAKQQKLLARLNAGEAPDAPS